ncbi:hypothetical protein CkaCkLH20_04678 [Colletotrichum karsti]|uniref:Chromo domain-containing protein n=1 Tax=Colletotrichum karsti TaxID=1095194 RepID=A0A9P6LN21_9PEZI|nr:uncharacterized protein CkaCkLH20_04678 [Colletotrichum karsti]KAF9878102.1 hypothetical protein CkaCkLH20_04678 [Colletotrichum karsti]
MDPRTYRVMFKWKRVGVREEHIIHEVFAQLINQNKVLEYWHQAFLNSRLTREQTLQCEFYHVFDILSHRRIQNRCYVLVQWVGYSDSSEDTTWEPLRKIAEVAPLDLNDYLTKKRLWRSLRSWPAWKKRRQDLEDKRNALVGVPSLQDEFNQRLRSESTARSSSVDLGEGRHRA